MKYTGMNPDEDGGIPVFVCIKESPAGGEILRFAQDDKGKEERR